MASSPEPQQQLQGDDAPGKYWTPSEEIENRKIAPKENDWKLPGVGDTPRTRTRLGGVRKQVAFQPRFDCGDNGGSDSSAATDEEYVVDQDDDEEDSTSQDEDSIRE